MYCQTIAETQCKNPNDYQCLVLNLGDCRDNNKICLKLSDGSCYGDPSNPMDCREASNNECVDHTDLF